MESAGCGYSDIIIIPDHLEFETEEGSQFVPPPQDIFIKKEGSGLPASWYAWVTAEGQQIWLKLSMMSGSVPKRVRVHCKSIGMPAGEWTGEIKVDSRIKGVKVTPSVIPVKLIVKKPPEPEPPEPEPPEPEPPEPEPPEPEPPEPEPPEPEPPKPPPEKSWLSKLIEWIRDFFRNWYNRLKEGLWICRRRRSS